MAICDSCGIVINEKPTLTCETNIFSLKNEQIRISPMETHSLLRHPNSDFNELFPALYSSSGTFPGRSDRNRSYQPGLKHHFRIDGLRNNMYYYLGKAPKV